MVDWVLQGSYINKHLVIIDVQHCIMCSYILVFLRYSFKNLLLSSTDLLLTTCCASFPSELSLQFSLNAIIIGGRVVS